MLSTAENRLEIARIRDPDRSGLAALRVTRRTRSRTVALAIVVALAALPVLAEPGAPIIAFLELRNHAVAVHADGGEQTYTVHGSEGTLLGEELSLAELSDLVPEVAGAIRNALAGGEPGFVWAGSDAAP